MINLFCKDLKVTRHDVKTWKLNKIWYFIKRVWYVEIILVVFLTLATRKWHHFVTAERAAEINNKRHSSILFFGKVIQFIYIYSFGPYAIIIWQQWTIVFGYMYYRILTDCKVVTTLSLCHYYHGATMNSRFWILGEC